jgi:hypothetical protein
VSNNVPNDLSPGDKSPSPEVFFRRSSSSVDNSHSNPHSRGSVTPDSNTSVSLPTLDSPVFPGKGSPDDIENEPPLENQRNMNSNENLRDSDGLRKRTAVNFVEE